MALGGNLPAPHEAVREGDSSSTAYVRRCIVRTHPVCPPPPPQFAFQGAPSQTRCVSI